METDVRTDVRTYVRTYGRDLESQGKAGPSWVRQKFIFMYKIFIQKIIFTVSQEQRTNFTKKFYMS